MDFRQLDYAITVAREGTLLAAAEKLYLSPSALSQHISRLEEDLHTPLFKRTRTGWVLTRAGEIYIEMAENVLACQRQAYLRISDIAEDRAGYFTVGVNPGRGTMMFSSVFPRFKQEYPNVRVGLFEGTVMAIQEKLAAGKVDVGFLTTGLTQPGLNVRSLTREELLLVVPRSHPLAQLAEEAPPGETARIDIARFREDEFLLAGQGTTLRTLADKVFERAGFAPHVAFETTSVLTLHLLSRGGYGISLIPKYYAQPTEDAVYFRPDPPVYWELTAACRRDHYISQAEEYMISLAADFFCKGQ